MATLGTVDVAALEAKLAATIAGVDAGLSAALGGAAPAGFALRQDGNVTVIGRKVGPTAEELWLWREMEWPAITAEPLPEEQEWRTLMWLAGVCGVAGLTGWAAEVWVPSLPWLAKLLLGIGVVAGGWDAAVDTWENLKKREIDIHFLMLAVAVGAIELEELGALVGLGDAFPAADLVLDGTLLERWRREVRGLARAREWRQTLSQPLAQWDKEARQDLFEYYLAVQVPGYEVSLKQIAALEAERYLAGHY